jgi:hypothetical protein
MAGRGEGKMRMLMIALVSIAAALGVAFYQSRKMSIHFAADAVATPAVSEDDRKSMSFAVLEVLQTKLPRYTDLSQWIDKTPEADLLAAKAKALSIRAWAASALSGLERQEYIQWIDYYYLKGYEEAIEELHTGKLAKRQADYSAEVSEQLKSAHRLTIAKPPM